MAGSAEAVWWNPRLYSDDNQLSHASTRILQGSYLQYQCCWMGRCKIYSEKTGRNKRFQWDHPSFTGTWRIYSGCRTTWDSRRIWSSCNALLCRQDCPGCGKRKIATLFPDRRMWRCQTRKKLLYRFCTACSKRLYDPHSCLWKIPL